jgi:hypothetical protein
LKILGISEDLQFYTSRHKTIVSSITNGLSGADAVDTVDVIDRLDDWAILTRCTFYVITTIYRCHKNGFSSLRRHIRADPKLSGGHGLFKCPGSLFDLLTDE